MEILIGIALSAIVLALVGVVLMVMEDRHTAKRLENLEQQSQLLRDQLETRRHTENTVAAMEDALAVLMRLQLEEQQQAQYRDAWVKRAQSILQTARQSPRSYPVDKPTGKRVRYGGHQ